MLSVVSLVLMSVVGIMLVIGLFGVAIDYISFRDSSLECNIGRRTTCDQCADIDCCLVGQKKRSYSRYWRD